MASTSASMLQMWHTFVAEARAPPLSDCQTQCGLNFDFRHLQSKLLNLREA